MTYTPKAPSEGIYEILVAAGFEVTPWRLGIGGFTDTPAEQVVIMDSAGQAPNPLYLLDYPAFQLMVRGSVNGYQAAYRKARDAYDILLGCSPRTTNIGADRWDGILAIGSPVSMGIDPNGRPIISCNFRAYYEPGQSTLSNRTPL